MGAISFCHMTFIVSLLISKILAKKIAIQKSKIAILKEMAAPNVR